MVVMAGSSPAEATVLVPVVDPVAAVLLIEPIAAVDADAFDPAVVIIGGVADMELVVAITIAPEDASNVDAATVVPVIDPNDTTASPAEATVLVPVVAPVAAVLVIEPAPGIAAVVANAFAPAVIIGGVTVMMLPSPLSVIAGALLFFQCGMLNTNSW